MKKAILQLHLAVLLWGFTGVLGKLIYLDAPVLVWYRMMLTALIILVILISSRQWISVKGKGLKKLTLIGALMAAHWVAFYASIKLSNASIALVCLSTASIFTSILDPIFNKKKHNLQELFLGLFAIVGMYFIYSFQMDYALGILLGIIAALLSTIFTILNKRIANDYPVKTMVFYEMGTGFILITLLLPIIYFFQSNVQLLPNQVGLETIINKFPHSLIQFKNDWIWLIVLSLCCTVWAQTLALKALKKLSPFTVTLSVNLEPIYGILLAILLFREDKQLNTGFYIGMILISLSVVFQMFLLLRANIKNR